MDSGALQTLYKQVLNVTPIPEEYAKIKSDMEEAKRYAEMYLAAQFVLSVLSTAAIVGTFLIALNRKR